MGGDGGSFASGRKYLLGTKEASRDATQDGKNIKYTQMVRSRTCSLSNAPLVEPIVACELGYLYNKEAVLSALLDKTLAEHNGGTFSHIRKMKDVVTLVLCPNPSSSTATGATGIGLAMSAANASKTGAEGAIETETSLAREMCRFICPITRSELDGLHPFLVIWPTGCVLSDKAMRELGPDALQAGAWV